MKRHLVLIAGICLLLSGCGKKEVSIVEEGMIITPTPTAIPIETEIPTPTPLPEKEGIVSDEAQSDSEVVYVEADDVYFADSEKEGLITHETGYSSESAADQIQNLYDQILVSNAWVQYAEFEYGSYLKELEEFNVRKDGDGYILDYAEKFSDDPYFNDYTIEITVNGDDIGIYITDMDRNEIATFIG